MGANIPSGIRDKIRSLIQEAESPTALLVELQTQILEHLELLQLNFEFEQGPYYHDIAAFHEKFGLNYDGPPRELPIEMSQFRRKFLQEELNEYCAAVEGHNMEKQLDGLVDIVYVALGTAYLQGFDFREAWRRVQAANMAKQRANPDIPGRGQYDVVKPPGWKAPILRDLVTYESKTDDHRGS